METIGELIRLRIISNYFAVPEALTVYHTLCSEAIINDCIPQLTNTPCYWTHYIIAYLFFNSSFLDLITFSFIIIVDRLSLARVVSLLRWTRLVQFVSMQRVLWLLGCPAEESPSSSPVESARRLTLAVGAGQRTSQGL